jgi:hypothetical protein
VAEVADAPRLGVDGGAVVLLRLGDPGVFPEDNGFDRDDIVRTLWNGVYYLLESFVISTNKARYAKKCTWRSPGPVVACIDTMKQ